MESIYTELALYGSTNKCARTDTVFLPISEVCNGTVSLTTMKETSMSHDYMQMVHALTKSIGYFEVNMFNRPTDYPRGCCTHTSVHNEVSHCLPRH